MADCITSAGGDLVEMDKWGIDLFVSGSQKCYGLPPGLAFIALSEKAEEKIRSVTRDQDFYSDMVQFANGMKNRNTPFTPAVSLFYGLQESLNLMLEEGMEQRIQRHREMGRIYREALQALGLDLFAEEGYRSNTVTTAMIPEGVDATKFSKTMLKYGVMIAGGQSDYKGKIFRFGHMNMVGPRELMMVTSVMEVALKSAGADIELGRGIATVQQALLD
jgi:aspartate aminotransferase-like enzyme